VGILPAADIVDTRVFRTSGFRRALLSLSVCGNPSDGSRPGDVVVPYIDFKSVSVRLVLV
jgi:hypothetical protein